VPLVKTNGIPTPANTLLDPGAQILLGQGSETNHVNYGTIPGLRATVGGWLNDQHTIGLEGSGFILQNRSVAYPYVFGATSAPTPQPNLTALPNLVGAEALQASNAVLVSSQTKLWGAEINGVGRLVNRPNGYLEVLTGFRYLDLHENLNIVDTFPTVDLSGSRTVQDTFTTNNQFYGGQLGLRTGLQWRWITLDGTAKVALGSTHEVVDVMGSTTITNGAFGMTNGVTPGGYFAQTTNSGRHTHDEFSVVPEAQGRIGFNLTSHVKLYAGYTFFYATDWVRPGNQVDHVNTLPAVQQAPLPGLPPGVVSVPATGLVPLLNRGDFFAHGVNFGLEFKY
jgi:hypothetical protein